jgi:hypothetical protein
LLVLCTAFSTASHNSNTAEGRRRADESTTTDRKTLSAASNSKDLYIPGGKSSWCRECTRCDTSSKKATPACKRACAKCPKKLILEAQQDITLEAQRDLILQAREKIDLRVDDTSVIEIGFDEYYGEVKRFKERWNGVSEK